MTRGITTAIVLAIVGSGALNLALYSIAHAGGPGEIAAIAAFEWNPLVWPWPEIITVALTVLGALAAMLRVLAPMTKTDKDDKLLGAVEWLTNLIAKIVVPKQVRANLSLGGGKSTDTVPFSSGGKSGGGAA